MKKVLISLITTIFFATSFYRYEVHETPKVTLTSKPEKLLNTTSSAINSVSATSDEIYSGIDFSEFNKLNPEVFEKAYLGFTNLKKTGELDENSHLLTICDFSLSSTKKRLWVIDLNEKKVVFNSLVAHGKNTGEEFAQKFSNRESSYQSSLGFYITDVTYNGENGFSLKLLGKDRGYNDAALQRAIVMHGADYVSDDFIKQQNRIGRSWGCPAVPRDLAEPIINTIKGKNVLFIYYPDSKYLSSSEWLKGSETEL
ncbi:murein L,D-transpeptidase catalytic domain family protein [Chryseobacterium suipulveris]|uniref:Murein L,D-transpeptidase catalytic domain family protein n=1 Tax=Chryseobacterium suipulveris TaxID=2929800 RepID=A0ABY4BPW0_9FLAO|nr:murein L,D-transpeptidase catalytic domain family protein [Chryseobacterium suipulveris]UOE41239.1 murein L,D-transpeptidase catalytic domain family protein [Chryseobacterium suipulveris]